MLKRFQTLLLLIVSGLLLSMFWADMCFVVETGQGTDNQIRFAIKFIEKTQFLIFTLTTFVISVISISYFKARIIQIRLCLLNIILLTGYQIWIITEFFKMKEVYTFTAATVFPFVCIILLFIVIKFIWRDEAISIASGIISNNKKKNK